MRIAYVLKRYPRFSETFVVNEILAHEAAGAEIAIFALRPPADAHFQPGIARVRASVNYLRHESVRANDFWKVLEPRLAGDRLQAFVGAADVDGTEVFQALQLAQALQDRGVDHIHAHFATGAATVARLASLLTNIPYTMTAHAKDIFHDYVNPIGLGHKVADAAAIITVSEYNKRHLQGEYPRQSEKIHRIYNGLPLAYFPFDGSADRLPVIVGVGRLVEKKGFSHLVTACSLLSARGVRFCCELIGAGELESSLRQQIADLRLDACVRLLGPLPSDEVATAIQRAAVVAAPCITATTGDRDGLPTVLLEAMALGTPCVATEVSGIPEIVRHEETGLLVPEGDAVQLASALHRVMADQRLARKMARSARDLMDRDFDIQRASAELRKLFAGERIQADIAPERQYAEAS